MEFIQMKQVHHWMSSLSQVLLLWFRTRIIAILSFSLSHPTYTIHAPPARRPLEDERSKQSSGAGGASEREVRRRRRIASIFTRGCNKIEQFIWLGIHLMNVVFVQILTRYAPDISPRNRLLHLKLKSLLEV